MLSCWQWRWPLGTFCGHWEDPRPDQQLGARRNAGIWPLCGAAWHRTESGFLKKGSIDLVMICYLKCVSIVWCLPSAPNLGMLAVLAALLTVWVFYQINMLGWSAEGLETLLYFQLLFVSTVISDSEILALVCVLSSLDDWKCTTCTCLYYSNPSQSEKNKYNDW